MKLKAMCLVIALFCAGLPLAVNAEENSNSTLTSPWHGFAFVHGYVDGDDTPDIPRGRFKLWYDGESP